MKYNSKMIRKYFFGISLAMILMTSSICSQSNEHFPNSVSLGDSRIRYYLHYDMNGNCPDGFGVDKLKDNIRAGDEIAVRFYPNSIFKIDLTTPNIPKPSDNLNSFIIFPESQKDTFSVQFGYGEVYFATKTTGAYELRIAPDTTKLKIGVEASWDLIKKDVGKYKPIQETKFEDFFKSNGFDQNLKVWVFKDIYFEKGTYCIEVYQRAGELIKLLARIKSVNVSDIFQNTTTIIQNDISNSIQLALEKNPHNGYYQSIINQTNTTAGILSFNICYDYAKGSWQYRQAPIVSNNKKLFYENQSVVISKVYELPSSVRIRAGFGVLNNLSEVRLISNLVLVMNPKKYFADSTPFLQCFNPTVGLQVGGTGAKDLILLLGVSFKLIKEGDLIAGFRFTGDGEKWQIGKHFYFGISLDPGLFGNLKNK